MALWRVLDYTSATLRVAVKHPPNNSLKLGKKTKLKAERRKRGQLLLCNKHLFCSAGVLPILVILRATRPCFLYSQ